MRWLSDAVLGHLREAVDWPSPGDRYEVIEPVGQGGMGKVYRARDRVLRRDVALKVLSITHCGEHAARRMMREARILAGLEHSGIVPIHDVGHLADGRIYYTMKLVKGSSLDAFTRDHPDMEDLLRVFGRICDAVAFAHGHGVIHRDLKPRNIMVGPFGEVLVMDWGVAKILDESPDGKLSAGADELAGVAQPGSLPRGRDKDESPSASAQSPATAVPHGDGGIGERRPEASSSEASTIPPAATGGDTHPGTILGTPGYMAPEQAVGLVDAVDERADIFSLGMILRGFVAATGGKARRPLEALIARATEPDPALRYATVAQLSADISNYQAGLRVAAHEESAWERLGRVAYRFRTPALLILAYAVLRMLIILLAGN